MYEFALVWDWLSFAVRWLHIITVIAWIGSSFYFIALDLGLRKNPDLPKGIYGEAWQVHGGGFYRIQKYLIAPDQMPEHLTWFKWESYATWLSGFALLAIVYYAGADIFLIDPTVAELSKGQAICISLLSIGLGWLVYDQLCKSVLGQDSTRLMILLYFVLVAMAWGYTEVFTGRAALVHLGAFTATIMSANVFFIIIPNQKIVVADLINSREPDPNLGKQAKQRSTHNNYLTLPIIFLMLSVHYPLAFASEYNWIIASLVFLMGVTIRHYFNSKHSGAGNPIWTWFATIFIFLAIMWLSTVGSITANEDAKTEFLSPKGHFIAEPRFEEVRDLVHSRCTMCHAREPGYNGLIRAPKNVTLETDLEIARQARGIYLHAGRSRAMPPPAVIRDGIELSFKERQLIVKWYEAAVRG